MSAQFFAANQVKAIRLGEVPAFDAWLYTFRAENNIEHHINPAGVAGAEQLAFMVALPEGGIYVPCADSTFFDLLQGRRTRRLAPSVLRQYAGAWRIVVRIVTQLCMVPGHDNTGMDGAGTLDRDRWRIMMAYCRHRFQGCLALGCILPSRLIKRLVTTIMSQMEGEDPWLAKRISQNQQALAFVRSPAVMETLNALPALWPATKATQLTLSEVRQHLEDILLARLLLMAAHNGPLPADINAMPAGIGGGSESESGDGIGTENENKARDSAGELVECGLAPLAACAESFVPVIRHLLAGCADQHTGQNDQQPVVGRGGFLTASRTFLYVCDTDGGLVFDLCVITELIRQGHKVVLAIKDSPFFLAPTLADMENDPLLGEYLSDGFILRGACVTKNELLRRLREHRLLIISDGTSELLNVYRTSTTFARAWKECDAVIAKGRRNKEVLLETSCEFTRDVFCFWKEQGQVFMRLRPCAPNVRKFSEADLSAKAANIIRAMRQAKDQGKAVMFYSCVIGSIPGQTSVAIAVAETFVGHLRGVMDDAFIINPAEYFEEGMDGDDLMFMWERVQRSGLINIWRFQSVEDIEASFALLGRRVPPQWSGKDATFSTGCTKEMRIALDMQRSHPELQIIGPAPEKFFRRKDYGVGKYFDATIYSSHQEGMHI